MKNKTKKRLGVVAAMLGLVVAIGAVAGNTLAKYISSVKVESEVATVAQWGYTITANANDLFSKTYEGNKIVSSEADSFDVMAEAKVVAPGTSSANDDADGALVITINGKAEVDAQLVIDISAFNTVWLDRTVESVVESYDEDGEPDEYTAVGDDVYYPLKWTITADGNEAELEFDKDSDEYDSLAEQLAAKIAENLAYEGVLPEGATVNEDESKDGKVVIDLPVEAEIEFDDYTLEIAWEWPFEQDADVEDTILGWLAAEVDGGTTTDGTDFYTVDTTIYDEDTDYNLEVKLEFSVTIVQVQGLTYDAD